MNMSLGRLWGFNKSVMAGILASVLLAGIIAYAADIEGGQVVFDPVTTSNETSYEFRSTSGSCIDTNTITVTVSGLAEGSGDPLSLPPVVATCGASVSGEWSLTLDVSTLADGSLDALIESSDGSSITVHPQKDTAAAGPSLTGVFVSDGTQSVVAEDHIFTDSTPDFEFTSDDNIVTATCEVNGFAAEDCSSYTYASPVLTSGDYTLTINAEDDEGNDMTAVVVEFTVDLPDSVHIKVMNGSDVAFDGDWELPAGDAPQVSVTPTDGNPAVLVDARSVLALLTAIDTANDSFVINDLQFSDFFDSFFLACMTFSGDDPACFYWQYTVTPSGSPTNLYAQVGMDQYVVEDGDAVYVFFRSDPLVQLELSDNEVEVGESFTVTAETFSPVTGVFGPAAGQILGAVQTDEFFNTTEFATSTADGAGTATLTVNTAGDYDVGMKEVGYYPTLALSVIEPVEESSGGGGGTTNTTTPQFSVPRALAYLSALQATDGSIANPLVSDWAALAFAASDPGIAKSKLRNYLTASSATPSSITDYERRAMALMALGINPYNGTSKDYITPIVNAFDGTQIGDVHLDNDDIFAIFPLLSAGYSTSDPMLQAVVVHILSAQRADGSWDGSPDMTAAAVQAIGPFFTTSGYGAAMGRAMGYLASTQQANGGWGSVDSTSWVQTMVNAAKELDPTHAPTFTSSGGRYPMDEIASAQKPDGAVRPTSDIVDNRVWSTSYAMVAASGKSWLTLLQPFSRPAAAGITVSGGDVLGVSATSTATTTSLTASSTPLTATSTQEIIATSTPTVVEIVQSTTTATTTPIKPKPE